MKNRAFSMIAGAAGKWLSYKNIGNKLPGLVMNPKFDPKQEMRFLFFFVLFIYKKDIKSQFM